MRISVHDIIYLHSQTVMVLFFDWDFRKILCPSNNFSNLMCTDNMLTIIITPMQI